jgi:lipoyl(octanoyl) transferase
MVPSVFQQPGSSTAAVAHGLPLDFYLVGKIDFDRAVSLQRRLAYEVGDVHCPRLAVLFCEHDNQITIGRDGSRSHIRCTSEQLQRLQVPVKWVGRGGGCIPHAHGQLAVYPIVPLQQSGWTVGEYLRRFQAGMRAAIEPFNVHTTIRDDMFGIWGSTGLLAAFGVAVRGWTTTHGAFLNVNPAMHLFHLVDSDPTGGGAGGKSAMSSLLAERRVAVTMNSVRTAVIEGLAAAFGCQRYHVHAADLRPGGANELHSA